MFNSFSRKNGKLHRYLIISLIICFSLFIILISPVNVFSSIPSNKNNCEIIISESDSDRLKSLHETFPDCKIIKKENMHRFNLIDYLSQLFK